MAVDSVPITNNDGPNKSIRPRRRSVLWIGVLTILVALGSWWGWRHKDDPRFINYAVALVPVALSVLIAFVPDLRRAHVAWRIGIIALGLVWSVLLWKQQALADKGQSDALEKVVENANLHSDQKIAEVREDLQDATQHSDNQIRTVRTDLKTTADALIEIVSKGETDLSKKIDGNKPIQPEHASLEVSFYTNDSSKFPILVQEARITSDLSAAVDFTFKNTSSVPAKGAEIWVQICRGCRYTKEPTGFSDTNGSDEHVRVKEIPVLNADVSWEKMTVEFSPPPGATSVQLRFEYRCENCAIQPPWNQTLTALLPFIRSIPPRTLLTH